MRPMRNVFSTVLALSLGVPLAGQSTEMQMMPAHDPAVAEPCPASADWFKPNAPEAGFALADTNCAFHQWAVQEFLYLVQPEKGLVRFLNLAAPHALFLYEGDGPAPYPGSAATQFKLGAGMARLRAGNGQANDAGRVVFLPRTVKTENTTFDGHTQAGSNAVLVDQQGQVVYYTSQINKVYYDFIRDHKYYTKAAYQGMPAETAFPLGTVEVKSSWRIAIKEGKEYMDLATRSKFYLVEGDVCKDNCNSLVPVTMALVGLHVVGRVKDHPEMVWATFEHYANAPDCNRTPFPSSGFSFYKPGQDCGKGPFWEKCNQIRKDDWTTPSEICRVHPDGEPGTTDNTANITSIKLSYAKLVPGDSIWKNYSYSSAVWTTLLTDPPKTLISLADASIRGSKKASNTSMESFNITQEKNCLHCHTYQPTQITGNCFPPGNKNIYLSHLVGLICDQEPQQKP